MPAMSDTEGRQGGEALQIEIQTPYGVLPRRHPTSTKPNSPRRTRSQRDAHERAVHGPGRKTGSLRRPHRSLLERVRSVLSATRAAIPTRGLARRRHRLGNARRTPGRGAGRVRPNRLDAHRNGDAGQSLRNHRDARGDDASGDSVLSAGPPVPVPARRSVLNPPLSSLHLPRVPRDIPTRALRTGGQRARSADPGRHSLVRGAYTLDSGAP